ncbi:MAG: homoserine dehydrogenase [Chloroflexota bacterium]
MKLMLIGFGVVGQGLVEILHDKKETLEAQHGFSPQVVGVATGSRGFLYNAKGLSLSTLLDVGRGSLADYPDEEGLERDFSDASDLIQGRGADVLVEISPTNIDTAMPATKHFQMAIATKKHIVTANKGPVAVGFSQLMQQAKDAGVHIRYEATLMAGTPAINTGAEALAGSGIKAVRGIVNGTTNYILTQMEAGLAYEDALKKAQELGYAETDPTADVEGLDAAAKVLIMMGAFFGKDASLKELDVTGITGISAADIAEAKEAGERYKLIAEATVTGGRVMPMRLPLSDPLAQVSSATNALTFSTELMGDVTVIGAGAGQKETGFALLSDLLALHRTITTR